MMSFYLVLLLQLIFPSVISFQWSTLRQLSVSNPSYSPINQHDHQLTMSTTGTAPKYSIRTVNEQNDIARVASFLSAAMYEKTVDDTPLPISQQNELARLERKDLSDRYGLTVGKKFYPASLVIMEEGNNIIGCVGVDSQAFQTETKKFRKLYPLRSPISEEEKVRNK